jgi:cytidine deaminase
MLENSESFEFIIGLSGGLGTNFNYVKKNLVHELKKANCDCFIIDTATIPQNKQKSDVTFSVIDYIFKKRIVLMQQGIKRVAYIIDSLSFIEEYHVLREIYPKNFVLISVFESPNSRVINLGGQLKDLENRQFDSDSQKIYHKAHYFMHFEHLHEDIKRFTELYFNAPFVTPTKDELSMMHAYVASLRSSALSRQVGAVITDDDGNILSSACNEVPKFGGGLCWEDTYPDLRDFRTADADGMPLSQSIELKKLKESSGMYSDASLEFYRTVDAEEACICDAARRGVPLQNSNLYSTTFPCHLCAKSIIAAGIKKVIYIESYPKSLSASLFGGLLKDNALKDDTHLVKFIPFRGVAPKRFKYLFKKTRKDRRLNEKETKIVKWSLKTSHPIHVNHFKPILYYWNEWSHIEKYYQMQKKNNPYELSWVQSFFEKIYAFYQS